MIFVKQKSVLMDEEENAESRVRGWGAHPPDEGCSQDTGEAGWSSLCSDFSGFLLTRMTLEMKMKWRYNLIEQALSVYKNQACVSKDQVHSYTEKQRRKGSLHTTVIPPNQ